MLIFNNIKKIILKNNIILKIMNNQYVGSDLYPTFEPVNKYYDPNFIGVIPPDRIRPEQPSEALNVNNDSQFPLGWFLLTIVLLTILGVVIYLYVQERRQLIQPTQCPQIKGNYGVLPGMDGTTLKQCGNNSNEDCISTEPSLEDAINLCDVRADICSVFSYNAAGEMRILKPNSTLTVAGSTDVYTRQVQILPIN